MAKKLEPDYDSEAIREAGKRTLPQFMKTVRDAFVAHKKEHPEPVSYKDLTPIQKRMQSGGPGVTTEEFTEVVEKAAKIRPKKTLPRD